MFDLSNKSQAIKTFKANLSTNYDWVTRGLVRIFEAQTAEEKTIQATVEHNKVGFNSLDAGILSSFAKQVINGRKLSEKQLAIAFKKMPKYGAQLYKLAVAERVAKELPFIPTTDFTAVGRQARGGMNND